MKGIAFKGTMIAGPIGRKNMAKAVILMFVAIYVALNIGVATAAKPTVPTMYAVNSSNNTVSQANLDGTGGEASASSMARSTTHMV